MALMGRIVMLAVLMVFGLKSTMAVTYTVGGSGGWALVNSNSFYDDQFSKINLLVGDNLSFPFTAPQHNVYEIPPSDLPSCDFANAIATYTDSNPVITLTTAGVHAFACEVPQHCSLYGMHLQVTVGAGAPVAAPASPPPAPVIASPPPPPPPAPVTPAPTVASPPTPAPVKAPVPAPVEAPPAPAPVKAPAPAPVKAAPAPALKPPVPARKPAAPISAPAPAPVGSGASFVSSGPVLVLGALFAGFGVVLL